MTTLNIICMYCKKHMGTKDGKGTTGTTSSICEPCWHLHFPTWPYPTETGELSRSLKGK